MRAVRKVDPRRIADAEARWRANELPHDIESALMKTWGVSRRTARRYWTRAANKLSEATSSISPEQAKEMAHRGFLECIDAARVPNEKTGQPNAAAMLQGYTRIAELHKAMVPTVNLVHKDAPSKAEKVHDELSAILARASGSADAGTAPKAN